jgi:hypothetical protein
MLHKAQRRLASRIYSTDPLKELGPLCGRPRRGILNKDERKTGTGGKHGTLGAVFLIFGMSRNAGR